MRHSSCWAQSASIRSRNDSARCTRRNQTQSRAEQEVGWDKRSEVATDDGLAGFWWDCAALVPPYNRSPKLIAMRLLIGSVLLWTASFPPCSRRSGPLILQVFSRGRSLAPAPSP